MRPQAALLVTLAVLAVLAALPLGKGNEEEEGAELVQVQDWRPKPRLCCDNCGACTRSIPPMCTCEDLRPGGCHPACKNCVKSGWATHGVPLYRCMGFITNFCKHRCTPAGVAA